MPSSLPLQVVFLGMGAAGVACLKLWQHAGVGHFIGVDSWLTARRVYHQSVLLD